MIAALVGCVLLAVITLYVTFGGADFGAGFWNLVAGGDVRGEGPRRLIEESITPVWESNHVWLIFGLVLFWTAYPEAFAAVTSADAVPLWLAVFGVVLRGAAFAFAKEAHRLASRRALGAIFAFSSLIAPFFMGCVVGGVAAGKVPANATRASAASWTGALSILCGLLFVGACAYLAAIYLVAEAAQRHDVGLQTYFIRRARLAGIATGVLSLAALIELGRVDPHVFDRLTGRALPLVILTGACGLVVLTQLTTKRVRGLRLVAWLGVASIVWGWGVAQYPIVLPGTDLSVSDAGAPSTTLNTLLVLAVIVLLLVAPSFLLLFRLQGKQLLGSDELEPSEA
ncbi:MAG: cytochrome bd ubiquinol oxidase subunit [Pseudonocardiales bacterium]|jgi:cytochrome d ubiquinol oxidase subunit II|nr:cytochrome d ubiquinol oxidase subunit [Pseudonocardiales bacterium]MDQ1750079.1 cytochrome bd ubiquinol oxidase subunit [Pseudonocardiales bacterium]MDT4960392.1 cytochrome bd ubiquinol oxidase subunit [Pseudonocardiales bacterium]